MCSVESQATVLVARRALARDAELTAADFQVESRRVPGLISAYVTDVTALAGPAPEPPGGQRRAAELRSARARQPGPSRPAGHTDGAFRRLEVRMNGVALADGRASDHIRVQNVSSQRVVEGIVRIANVVEAPL